MEEQKVPPEVQHRLKYWIRMAWFFRLFHLIAGMIGVVAGAIAALGPDIARIAGIFSGAAMAFIGFVEPDRNYFKYIMAWRILNEKANLYKYGFLPLKDLLEVMGEAERAIESMERVTSISTPASSLPSVSPSTKSEHRARD